MDFHPALLRATSILFPSHHSVGEKKPWADMEAWDEPTFNNWRLSGLPIPETAPGTQVKTPCLLPHNGTSFPWPLPLPSLIPCKTHTSIFFSWNQKLHVEPNMLRLLTLSSNDCSPCIFVSPTLLTSAFPVNFHSGLAPLLSCRCLQDRCCWTSCLTEHHLGRKTFVGPHTSVS